MYCAKCGASLNDGAKFCPSCGQATGAVLKDANEGNSAKSPQAVEKTQKTKKQTKRIMPLISTAIILGAGVLACVVLIKLIIEKRQPSSSAKKVAQSGESSIYSGFSLDEIDRECDGCHHALSDYIDLVELGRNENFDTDGMNAYSEEKYSAMHHTCHAKATRVKDMPYVYRGCYGTYTGDWQGAGPVGKGTFVGTSYYLGDTVSYEGDWNYGLPEGNGELYIENFDGSGWNLTYKGQMYAGMRNGSGYVYEYLPAQSYRAKYRIYAETVFQNDIMAQITDCEEHDAETGEILTYYQMTGDEDGWVQMVNSWGANEMSPQEKQALEFGVSVITIALVGKMVEPIFDGSSGYDYDAANEKMLADLDDYRQKKEKDAAETKARQKEEDRKFADYCYDEYQKEHAIDPTDGSLWAQFTKKNMYYQD